MEFASVLAGPAVGMFFAELGAQVIKIENKTTGGDVTRRWKNPLEDPGAPVSAYWSSVNWGKTHLFLDLSDPAEQSQALELALSADVVISNFKPSSARRMGVDAAALCSQNARLIYAQLNSFADPEDESPAFDAVLQAEAGFMYMNGEAGRPPVKMPVALIDILAAHQLKEAVLLALLHREKTGRGCFVATSLMESALSSLANQATNYLMNGFIPQRMGAQHPNIAPYGDMYSTADGHNLLLAVGTEKQFERLCACLDLPELPENPDYAGNAIRVKNRASLNKLLAERIIQLPLDYWMALFKEKGIPAARIRDMQQVFELPEARAMVLQETSEDGILTRRLKTVAFEISEISS